MKKLVTFIILIGLPFMVQCERIIIDFCESNWSIKLKEAECEKTFELEFINYNPEIVLP